MPLGTNILTLSPGRYSIDGVTEDTWDQMNLPVLVWHYEIVVLGTNDEVGLINNYKVITVYPFVSAQGPAVPYTNEMQYDGTWTGWVKNATATPPQVYDLPLAVGITNIDGTTSKYWMNQDSTVHVEISVQAASELADASLVATLPEGFLPAESQPRYIGNDAFLTIQPGGEIQLFLRGGGSLPARRWICAEFNYEANSQT